MFLTTPLSTLPSARMSSVCFFFSAFSSSRSALEERLARQHDVAALLVDLDHAHAQFLAAQRVQVAHGTDVDLRSGQERADADVHRETALDALDDAADDDLALGIGLLDFVPNL